MRRICLAICSFAFVAAAFAQEKPRVFITDSKSWEITGGGGGSSAGFGGGTHGGARPQTAEIIKTFGERCPSVTVNNKQERADYVVLLDHEGGKGLIRKDNKVAVFNFEGDSILSRSTRSLGNSVQDACGAIEKDWAARGGKHFDPKPAQAATSAAPQKAPEFAGAKVSIASQPLGADIEVDGSFVGNSPSVVSLPPGEHTIAVKKSGYKAWERKIKTTMGEVNITAELEKAP